MLRLSDTGLISFSVLFAMRVSLLLKLMPLQFEDGFDDVPLTNAIAAAAHFQMIPGEHLFWSFLFRMTSMIQLN